MLVGETEGPTKCCYIKSTWQSRNSAGLCSRDTNLVRADENLTRKCLLKGRRDMNIERMITLPIRRLLSSKLWRLIYA